MTKHFLKKLIEKLFIEACVEYRTFNQRKHFFPGKTMNFRTAAKVRTVARVDMNPQQQQQKLFNNQITIFHKHHISR